MTAPLGSRQAHQEASEGDKRARRFLLRLSLINWGIAAVAWSTSAFLGITSPASLIVYSVLFVIGLIAAIVAILSYLLEKFAHRPPAPEPGDEVDEQEDGGQGDGPTEDEPTEDEPTAAPAEAAKPAAAKPAADKPAAAEPKAAKPEADKPAAAKPEVAKPEAAKPEAAAPAAEKPAAAKPMAPGDKGGSSAADAG